MKMVEGVEESRFEKSALKVLSCVFEMKQCKIRLFKHFTNTLVPQDHKIVLPRSNIPFFHSLSSKVIFLAKAFPFNWKLPKAETPIFDFTGYKVQLNL